MRCTARAARTRPNRPPARRIRSPPSRTSRASQQLSDDFAAAGLHPFHAPCGVMLDEGNMPYSACVRCSTCDGFPCLVHAKSDAEVLGVRPGARARQRHAADERHRGQLKHQPGRDGGHRGRGRARRRARELTQPTSSSSPPALPTPPSCCSARPTTSTPRVWPTAQTRSGATTCSTTARPCSRSPRSPTRPSFRRPLASTTTTSQATQWEFPMGNIQMVGKSVAEMYRGEKPLMTKLAPTFRSRRSPRTPSTSGSRPRIFPSPRTA